MAQADRLGPHVGGRLALCCICHVNSCCASALMIDDSTINIVVCTSITTPATRKDIVCPFVCLSICRFVGWIAEKVMNGFQ